MTDREKKPPPTDEEVSAAAAVLARRVTPARQEAARNASRAPRPSRQGVPLSDEVKANQSKSMTRVWAEKKAKGETIATGRAPQPLDQILCNCGGSGLDHKSTCPRGRAIRRRQKAGEL